MSEQALAVSNPITQDGHDGSSRNVNAFSSEAAFVVGQAIAPFLGVSAWPLVLTNAIGGTLIALSAWILVRRAYAPPRVQR